MGIGNLQNFGNLFNGSQPLIHKPEIEETIPKSTALYITALTTLGITQITMGAIGIAGKIGDPPLGWSLVALGGASILVPVIRFFCLEESSRTSNALCTHIFIPILWWTAPIVCGALTATGQLAARIAGLVTVAITGGALGLGCCCGVCVWRCNEYLRKLNSSDDSQQIANVKASMMSDKIRV